MLAAESSKLMYGFDSLYGQRVDPGRRPRCHLVTRQQPRSFVASTDSELNHEIDASPGWLSNDRGVHERSMGLGRHRNKAFGDVQGQFEVDVQLDEYGATEGRHP